MTLNYEDVNYYEFETSVADAEGLEAIFTVVVTVKDENEAPKVQINTIHSSTIC